MVAGEDSDIPASITDGPYGGDGIRSDRVSNSGDGSNLPVDGDQDRREPIPETSRLGLGKVRACPRGGGTDELTRSDDHVVVAYLSTDALADHLLNAAGTRNVSHGKAADQ